jgi:hypothetical protein
MFDASIAVRRSCKRDVDALGAGARGGGKKVCSAEETEETEGRGALVVEEKEGQGALLKEEKDERASVAVGK